jgi:hypothetical protein
MVCNDLTENKYRKLKDPHQMFELWPNFLTYVFIHVPRVWSLLHIHKKNVQYARCLRYGVHYVRIVEVLST